MRFGKPDFSRALRRLAKDDRGAIMLILGLIAIPLFVLMGLAVDVGRGYMVRSKLSYAIDSAGLAGGRAFETDLREDDILMFFEANFPSDFMEAEIEGGHPTVVFDEDANTIEVTATAVIPTRFMSVAGIDEMRVSARTLIQRELQGLELVLVMDNTGSMRSGSKIDAMKDAAQDLIDILYGAREEVPNFWVGLVPYAATVNIGDGYTAWLDGYDAADFAPTTWKGCVEARDFPNDSNDAVPATEGWAAFRWQTTLNYYWSDGYEGYDHPSFEDDDGDGIDDDDEDLFPLGGDNDWDPDGALADLHEENEAQNEGTGPNLGCPPAITPLVAEKSTVTAAIDEMQPWHRGGTFANLGLAWGWRNLSPAWRGLWSGSADGLPLNYNEPNMNKVVILLTDGVNQWYDWPGTNNDNCGDEEPPNGLPGRNSYDNPECNDYRDDFPGADYTAYGRLNEGRLGTTNNNLVDDEIDDRMLDLCTAMKAEDIIIYAITFQVSNAGTQTLFQNCATDADHYFNSPSNSELQQAFVTIADELSNLRIAE